MSAIHSIPICDTPQRRGFKLYITSIITDLPPRQGRSKSFLFQYLFHRVNTYFTEPLKSIQVKGDSSKGNRITIFLHFRVKPCINQLLVDGHTEKLSRCSEIYFLSPTVITAKMDGSNKLALLSKLLNKQTLRKIYQMPDFFELIKNVALTISGHDGNKIWFSSIDFKYGYSQILLSRKTRNQCKLNTGEDARWALIDLKRDFTA